MPWLLVLFLGISFGQECVLQPNTACSTSDITLTLTDNTAEDCAEACLSNLLGGESGCCAFDSSLNSCTISPGGTTILGSETSFAEICTASCEDNDDVFLLGIPHVFTCDDLFIAVAETVNFSKDMCDTPTTLLSGDTLRPYCCDTCASLDDYQGEPFAFENGECRNAALGVMPAYVQQPWIPFTQCVNTCAETRSCSGISFFPEFQSTCKIHVHAAYHNEPQFEFYTSFPENDGLYADSSTDNRAQGICLLQLTQAPSFAPSTTPSVQPSGGPSVTPTHFPSTTPSVGPSFHPTVTPTPLPSQCPSVVPSNAPSTSPSKAPTFKPSTTPSGAPSTPPTRQPTDVPSVAPSVAPSKGPSVPPTGIPSTTPSHAPSTQPSKNPSTSPSRHPTHNPSTTPSTAPSHCPSVQPTAFPSDVPSKTPTDGPSVGPSVAPSNPPSVIPSFDPSTTPSHRPSICPTTRSPSTSPSVAPSYAPSTTPSKFPTGPPSEIPSNLPSTDPTIAPSFKPSTTPSHCPSTTPTTSIPSTVPSLSPSMSPSGIPSGTPSVTPTVGPSGVPTVTPSNEPSVNPSKNPSTSPSNVPTLSPSFDPSAPPSTNPSVNPSRNPTVRPSELPSGAPSFTPSVRPSVGPSISPSFSPSEVPSTSPSVDPSVQPSNAPSHSPTITNPCSPSDMNILGSDFITLHEDHSSFENDVLTLGIGYPDRYRAMEISFSGATNDGASFTGPLGGFWTTFMDTAPGNECLRILQGTFNWQDILDNVYMGLGLHYAGEKSYFMNTMTLHFKENATSYNFKIDIERDIYVDIPWLIELEKLVQLSIEFDVGVPTFGPSTAPSVAPSRGPSFQPSNQPSTCPSFHPSTRPSLNPSTNPSVDPSVAPSYDPSKQPSHSPSTVPSHFPSFKPSVRPSLNPSTDPSIAPSKNPTLDPTVSPSTIPSKSPSFKPSVQPSTTPSHNPSTTPSKNPTFNPSVVPSNEPSKSPSFNPSVVPSVAPSTNPSKSPTPREEISIDVEVEAWQFFTLGDVVDGDDHEDGDLFEVLQTTDVGSFNFNTQTVVVSDVFAETELAQVSYSPEVVAANTTTVFVLESTYKRYTINVLVIHPDACVGEWSAYTECSVTCDSGTQSRTFSIITEADQFGDECAFNDGEVQTQTCQVVQCPNLDKIVLEFAVAEPDLTGQTRVTMNYTTYVQWPWKVIEQNHTCFQIIDDTTGKIIDESDDWYIIDDCIPDYIYGEHDGTCVGESGSSLYVPGIYIRNIENITDTICEEICNALDECEGYDVHFDRPEAERRVCQVLGKDLTSEENDWVRENYGDRIAAQDGPFFFFRRDVFTPETPIEGSGPNPDGSVTAKCYIRNTPVYEGDCVQTWHGNFLVDAVCDVSGSYTLQTCTQHQVTEAVDIAPITMDMTLDTACGSVVGSLDLQGEISTFADDQYTFQSNIYHVEDLVYARSVVTSRVELTDITLVGLVAQQNFEPADIFNHVTAQDVTSLSQQVGSVSYETTIDFSFRLDNIEGSGDGLTTVLFATFEASYVNGLRRLLLVASDEAPVGIDHTLVVFPGPCHNPSAPYNHLLTETCGYDLKISICSGGEWVVMEDNIQGACDQGASVHISEEVPPHYGTIESEKVIIDNRDSVDNESIWFTVTVIAVVACAAGLCVWLYFDRFGESSKPKSAIVKFQDSIDNLETYETRKREPATSVADQSDFDDLTSEISVTSTIRDEDTMNVVFSHLFSKSEQL